MSKKNVIRRRHTIYQNFGRNDVYILQTEKKLHFLTQSLKFRGCLSSLTFHYSLNSTLILPKMLSIWEFIFLGGVCRSFCNVISFVRYTCLNHIAVGAISLPDRFEHVSSPLYAQEVSKDEYTHLTSTSRHEKRGKITCF